MESLHRTGTLIKVLYRIGTPYIYHVPSGNLFPTVQSYQPTKQRVYLLTKRVHLPTN
ncbi:hypothetical protein V2W45_1366015 [Cenococcum geophilum]